MKTTFSSVVSSLPAEYADLRFEENRKIRISYEGKELTQVATTLTSGGHMRAYADGGKAIGSFSAPERAETMAQSTCASASLVGKSREKKLKLAPAPAITEDFLITPSRDPRKVSLKEKLELTAHYNELVLKNPNVITTQTVYDEFTSRRVFVNSEGSAIEYDLINVGVFGMIVVKKGPIVQRVRFAFGGNTEYGPLLDREADLQKQLDKACQLLDAEPARAGIYPVVLDPSESGVFIHEAFGHLSEADGLQNNPSFRAKLQLGRMLAKPILNVVDDATRPNLPGSYDIDDEGVRGMRTPLITEGVLSGRMHSRETAAEFGEPLSGNMRAVDVQFTPIVRMSNILIEPGEATFDDMIASIDDGYYLVGAKGGQTSGDQFTFGAQWGYRIQNGKLGIMVRDINMSGELFSTLEAISMIGDDVKFGERGGCGKGGGGPMQMNRKSGKGSPHIKIDAVTIGGI
jgi:TldD protein